MTSSHRVGNYDLSLEQRGLRLTRLGESKGIAVRPFVGFSINESGRGRMPFALTKLTPGEKGGVQLLGQCGDEITITIAVTPSMEAAGLQFHLQVVNARRPLQLRMAVEMTLTGEAEPRWLVPGFFYGENRPALCQQFYPAYSEVSRDLRRFTSNQWSFRADRTAAPLVCSWTYGCFAWLATDGAFGQSDESPEGVGMSGLRFSSDEGQPVIGCEFPYSETPLKYSFCHDDKTEPEEVFVFLPENTAFHAAFQLGFEEPRMEAYATIQRALYYHLGRVHPRSHHLPPEYTEQVAHLGLLRWHYSAQSGAIYEATTFEHQLGAPRTDREPAVMQSGWMGGAVSAYTLLRAGREGTHPESVTAATAVLNRITSQLSPAGTLFPAWSEHSGWACSFGPEEGTAHSRTVAEAVLFILKALALELKHNANHPTWFDAAVNSLNYAVGAQQEDGAFPVYYDLATGRPITYEGSGGIAWIAAMVLGANLLHRPHYRDVAVRAGDHYAKLLASHDLWGSVEDQLYVPTCDDAHWALIGYMALYEADHDLKWLALARKAADLALSWRMTYNTPFSPHSLLGRYGVRTKGGDIGSVASPTLGITGLISWLEMRKLAAFLGDSYYEQRADDARHYATQMVALEESQFNARAGMVLGQIAHTDFLLPKGSIAPISSAISATLIKLTELQARTLNVTKAGLAPVTGEELAEVLSDSPTSYAEVALASEAAGSSAEIRSPFEDVSSGMAGILGLSSSDQVPRDRRASRSSGEVALPFPSGADNPIAAMLGIRDSQPLRTPLPLKTPTPRSTPQPSEGAPTSPPFTSPQAPFSGGNIPNLPSVDDGQSSEEVEIKYKIF